LAIFLVLGYHFNIPGFYAGYLGVDIFFVLSGYLITGNILKELEKKNEFSLINFWSRRIFRLAPALLFLLFLAVFWNNLFNESEVLKGQFENSLSPCLFYYANWFFIQDMQYFGVNFYSNGLLHIWSLSLEEQFYIFWPAVIFICTLVIKKNKQALIFFFGSALFLTSLFLFI
jgi:peptidoglycan/LPS O-acetylase OafA/YrhL